MDDPELLEAYRFFRKHAGWGSDGHTPEGRHGKATMAMELARAERRGVVEGLCVLWETDDIPWDGDCPRPRLVLFGQCFRASEVLKGSGNRIVKCLASIGGVGVDSWQEPFLRVTAAELVADALHAEDLRKEAERMDAEVAWRKDRGIFSAVCPCCASSLVQICGSREGCDRRWSCCYCGFSLMGIPIPIGRWDPAGKRWGGAASESSLKTCLEAMALSR